jgi:hypothetical protein
LVMSILKINYLNFIFNGKRHIILLTCSLICGE